MISYWEQQHFTNYHYIVIGGGIVGISTALSLREKDPRASILVLERGVLPTGASTRNAGFACFGSLTELLADIKTMGAVATCELVAHRWEGLRLLRKRLGDKELDYKNYGGFELLFQKDLESLSSIDSLNQLLSPLFGRQVFSLRDDLIDSFGFNKKLVAALVSNPLEGQLDTGAMMQKLMALARSRDIPIFSGADVTDYQIDSNGVEVMVSNIYPGLLKFRAQKVAICTNAFSSRLLPNLELKPGRGLVMVTAPIPHLKFRGVFHYDQGYYYFRNVGNRVMFGGGRNLDIKGEETLEFGQNPSIMGQLKEQLAAVVLPGTDFKVDHHWSGIMAFGPDKRPLVGLQSPQVGYAVRLGGMGVALGSLLGDQLSSLLCLNG